MLKSQVKTAEDIEGYYKNVRKIRFSEDFVINPETLFKDIIFKLFAERVPTFTVRLKHQCRENRNRSIDDFIKICKYYAPESSVSEIMRYLINHSTTDENRHDVTHHVHKELVKTYSLYFGYCTTIRKDNSWLHFAQQSAINSCKMYFDVKNFSTSGFPNCNIKYKDL